MFKGATHTNDLTDARKKKYDDAYLHSTTAHAPTTIATTSAIGLMSSTDKSNVDANTAARHTHVNKSILDTISSDWINSLASQSFVMDKISLIPIPDVIGQISTHNADSSAHQDIRNLIDTKISTLINGAPTTLDTLKEIADAMTENKSVVDALEASIGSKANSSDLSEVATSGLYNDLLEKPILFLGTFYYQDSLDEIDELDNLNYGALTSIGCNVGLAIIVKEATSGLSVDECSVFLIQETRLFGGTQILTDLINGEVYKTSIDTIDPVVWGNFTNSRYLTNTSTAYASVRDGNNNIITSTYSTKAEIKKLGTSNWNVSQDASGNLIFTYS